MSISQVSDYYRLMSDYFSRVGNYYANPSSEAPLFMESLSGIQYADVLTESLKLAKGNPSMVSGALIEAGSSIAATLREAGLRSKVRSDFFGESESSAKLDARAYANQGQILASYINGRNNAQN